MQRGRSNLLNQMLLDAEERFIPFSMLIEVTHRCNFDCVHCYQAHQHKATRQELSTDEWCQVLEQARDLGTFFLTISGGEMLVRRDWFEIAQHARRKGFVLKLYTNGSMITPQIADRMAELDVMGVEVSVYSHTSTVFDEVTQRKGSFARTIQGIRLLSERNIPVTIKTPIMRQNVDSYKELLALAEELGVYYIFDPQLVPRNDGDLTPLQYQVDNAELAALYNDPALYDQPCNVNESAKSDKENLLAVYDRVMNSAPCGSGRRIVVVDPYGEVYGCLQMMSTNGNIRQRTLSDIWWNGENFREVRTKLRKDLVRCETCPGPPHCKPCMGLSLMEHGEILGRSKIACRQNHLRWQRAMAARGTEVDIPEWLGGNPKGELPALRQASAIATPITIMARESFQQLKKPQGV
ncbi:MAG: radical SAM protein [Chloroflexia bacterium]